MPTTRVVLFVVAGVVGGCSLALDFDSRAPDAPAKAGTSSGETDAGSAPLDGGEASSSSGTVSVDGGPTGTDCPGTGGPKAIRVGEYCIDSTEVTNAQYAAFLADNAKKVEPPAGCGAAALEPNAFPGANALPVVNIDWCGAFAFCKWAGKRLCGKIGGGAAESATTDNQWFDACSAKGTKQYPYGATFDDEACVFGEVPVRAVGSKATCVGGSPGLFDMSGNVSEWEDACSGDTANAPCRIRGGDADEDKGPPMACGSEQSEPRNKRDPFIGFRCCSP